MSAVSLPLEILEVIFKQLSGKDATNCRAVCRRWRDVVDSLPDEAWLDYCLKDYWNPKTAHKKASLTYRELYKSIALWSKVETAEIKCKQVPIPNPNHFIILKNKLAVTYNSEDTIFTRIFGFSNTVEYYDLDTLELLSRRRYKFLFNFYNENDKLIAMVTSDGRLCVIPKLTRKLYFVANLPTEYGQIGRYTLFDTEVYFVNDDSMLCVARLKVKNGVEKIKSIEFDELEHENVVAFSNASKDRVYMLTDEGNIYYYSHVNKEFVGVDKINRHTFDMVYELWEFGFDWSHPDIYEWMTTCFTEKIVNITKKKSAVLCRHNHIVLMGTNRQLVHIFKRPYDKNGNLILYTSKPDRSIDIGRFCKSKPSSKPMGKQINLIDTVEIQNGHKIVVLNEDKLFVLDLVHEGSRFTSENGENQETTKISDYPALKVAKKIARTKTKPNISTKVARKGGSPTKRGALYVSMSRILEKRMRSDE